MLQIENDTCQEEMEVLKNNFWNRYIVLYVYVEY